MTEFGLGVLADQRPGDYARLAAHAEALGFDVLSVFGDLMYQPPILALLDSPTAVAKTVPNGTIAPAPKLRRRGVSTNSRTQGLPRTTFYRRPKNFLQCIGLGICSDDCGDVLQLSGHRE